jgi:hypothetical protein
LRWPNFSTWAQLPQVHFSHIIKSISTICEGKVEQTSPCDLSVNFIVSCTVITSVGTLVTAL